MECELNIHSLKIHDTQNNAVCPVRSRNFGTDLYEYYCIVLMGLVIAAQCTATFLRSIVLPEY